MTLLGTVLFVLILLFAALLVAGNASVIYYLLIAYMPINTLLPEGLPYREAQALLRFAAFAGTILYCVLRRIPLRSVFLGDRLSRLLLIWLGVMFLSLVVSGHYSPWAERSIVRMASYIAVYFVFRAWKFGPEKFHHVCWVLSGTVFACALFAIVQVVCDGYTPLFDWLHNAPPYAEWMGRPPSFLNSGTNAFGGFMGLLLPFEIALLHLSSRRSAARVFHLAVIALSFVSVILSGSRGAALSITASSLLAVLCFSRQNRTRIVAIATTAIVLPTIILVAGLISPRLTHVDQEESVATRYLLWAEAGQMFLSHPVTGIGLGNFRESYDPAAVEEDPGKVDVHNLYLQFLTETGIIGLVVFASIAVHVIRRGAKNLKRVPADSIVYAISYAAIAAMLSVLIHGMVDFFFIGSTEFGAAFATLLALFATLDHQHWAMSSPLRTRRVEARLA
jgi:O-antigen ligase